MRTSRCTPRSALRKPYAYWPRISSVASLIPASSPSCRSSSSTSKPLRSPKRVYMRSSICAQSWLSVPPAPGWMVMSASRWSSGCCSMFLSSSASSAGPMPWTSRSTSSASPSSGSASSSSSISPRSSTLADICCQGSTHPLSWFTSLMISRAFSPSFQNDGSSMRASSPFSFSLRASRSKKPPQLVEPVAVRVQVFAKVGHVGLLMFPPMTRAAREDGPMRLLNRRQGTRSA